ncbi:MAG: glycosyltransferase family 4 protein [Microthrixaceae bacterium]
MARAVVWIGVHDLSLTGVPVMLERLLAASAPDDRARVHVVALQDGPMHERIAAVAASMTVLAPAVGRSGSGSLVAAARSVGLDAAAGGAERALRRRALRSLPSPDVVVAHGAGAWAVVGLAPGDPAAVLHLHELDTALKRSIPARELPGVLARVGTVMVVSRPVGELARRTGVTSERIVEVPGVYDVAAPHDHDTALAALGGGHEWVLGAGSPVWRKGADRMAAIAFDLARSGSEARVGWVGGAPDGVDACWVEAEDPVEWFPARPDPWSLLAGASVFLVPSREDPLPLVALEAGRHRRPVVATPSGGLVDLLAGGRGLVSEGHDLGDLVTLTRRVLDDPPLARDLGDALGEHVERHHSPELVARTWWSVLDGAVR